MSPEYEIAQKYFAQTRLHYLVKSNASIKRATIRKWAYLKTEKKLALRGAIHTWDVDS